nr:nucleotidyltransferase family protein [uncultured Sphingomonas sp.]
MSPELRLAIACCRYPHGTQARDSVAAALAGPIDWPAFEIVVQRHRITGLAASALCADALEVPADVRRRLAGGARRFAAQDLLQAAETAKLQQIFDQAGIPALFLKGAVVGILAYGRLGIKQSWDIDLLTTEACMTEALQVLELSGYRLVEPMDLPRHALPRFAGFYHEAQLCDDRGVTVELHWRLFSKPILTGITAESDTQIVEVGGRQVRTLCESMLIAYLIAHGQEHGWSRLKWIADLNALLAQKSDSQLAALHAQGSALGLEPKTSAALLLCEQLFSLPLPDRLEATLRQNHAAERLVKVSLACMAHPLMVSSLPGLSRLSLALIASRFSQGSSWSARFGELRAIWTQPRARARYPTSLDFLYHLLRIPIWLMCLPLKVYQLRRSAVPGRDC